MKGITCKPSAGGQGGHPCSDRKAARAAIWVCALQGPGICKQGSDGGQGRKARVAGKDPGGELRRAENINPFLGIFSLHNAPGQMLSIFAMPVLGFAAWSFRNKRSTASYQFLLSESKNWKGNNQQSFDCAVRCLMRSAFPQTLRWLQVKAARPQEPREPRGGPVGFSGRGRGTPFPILASTLGIKRPSNQPSGSNGLPKSRN